MKDLKKYVPFLGLVLVAIAVVMLFLEPSLVYKLEILGTVTKTDVEVSAFNIIFGIEDGFDFNVFGIEYGFDLNVLGIVALALLVVGAILPLLKEDKTLTLVAAIALIAGGVLMFVFPTTISIDIGSFAAAWPLIVAGILGIVAGGLNLLKLLV